MHSDKDKIKETPGEMTKPSVASAEKYFIADPKGQLQLFANPIDTRRAFGITRHFADGYKRIAEEITPQTAEESYKYHNKIFKSKATDFAVRVIDKQALINTPDAFYRALERLKDPVVIQGLMALWNFANGQGTFLFKGIRLSEIMETKLKKPKSGYFTQEQRKEFSKTIYTLTDFAIALTQSVRERDDKGKLIDAVAVEFYPFFELIGATYTKRKQALKNDKGDTIAKKGDPDYSVILRVYGELLPGFNKGIMRGRLYSKGILELDANKDGNAITLGFMLMTRFDQLRQGSTGKDKVSDDNLYITQDRKALIEGAGYSRTDQHNKRRASDFLENTLNKLIEAKVLMDYKPREISTDDSQRITLYPYPIAIKIEDKSRQG